MITPRIITMLPSATEITCALGFEKMIVSRSHECDYPESIKRLPACTESKIEKNKSSREIDDQVKTIVEQGLSVYRVDADLLKKIRPDIIITQTQCEVCAASPKDLELAIKEWLGSKPEIVSLEPNGLSDVWLDIRKVSEAAGDPAEGEVLISKLQKRMRMVEEKANEYFNKSGKSSAIMRPRVLCIEWIDPLMAAGNWIPELVEMAGGEDIFGVSGQHSPWISWDSICTADPDVIIIMPCGYTIQDTIRNLQVLTTKSEWPKLKAVSQRKVYIVDGNQYFNRPGPRLVESLEIMLQLLFRTKFEHDVDDNNTSWVQL